MKLQMCGLGLAIVLAVVPGAFAQNDSSLDAGRKIRDGGMAHGAQYHQRHAQNQSQILYYYSQSQHLIPKAEAKELIAGIKGSLTAADKSLAKLKADHAKEPEVQKLITSIEKHQAKAHEVCGMAEEHCLKEHGDHVIIGDCCSEMWHEIDAAHDDTAKLMKLLKIDNLAKPKKVTAKSDGKK